MVPSMSLLIAMISFALVMSISPGPVNMVILSSGVNYGVKRTIPYLTGATIGFTSLLMFLGLGFYQIIQTNPDFLDYLAIGGSVYIIYMGTKITAAKPEISVQKKDVPQFHQGFLLQWLNPKAWIACVSGVAIFSSAESTAPFLTFTSVYFPVCYISMMIWAIMGDKVSLLLNSPIRLRLFNMTMGILLIATGAYLGFNHFYG